MIRKHYLLLILAMILCLPLATYAADKPKPNMLRADERNDAISGGTAKAGAPPDELMRFRIMYATYAESMWDGRIPGHLHGDGDDLGRGGNNLGKGGDDLGKGGDDLGGDGDDLGKGGDPEHGTPTHENTRTPFDPTASDHDPKSGDSDGKGNELKAKEGKPGFWDWLIGGASEALDKGLELWESTVDSVKETVRDAIDTVVDTVKDVVTTVVDAVVDAGKWVEDHWEVVLVTTAGVALTVGGVFFPPLLPFGVSILVGEGISGVIGYAFGMRGDELLREMALGGVLSAAGFGAGALIGKAATAVARLKPVANALGKASALTSRATSAVRTAVGKGAQAAGAAARWVRQTSVGRAAARLGTQAANAVRSATSAAGKAGNALRSALASTAKQAGGALRAVTARIGQTRLAQSAASVAKNVRSAASSAGNAVKNSSVYRAVASLGRNTGKGIGKLASNVGSGLRTVAKTTGSKMQSIVQTVKKTAPVRAVAGFTRKAGTQISQSFRQIGSAISRSLATTVLRSKTAGAGEGFAVSVMDDRARGEKVDYRKAVIAAAIGALLVTGGSIGLNKAYSTGQETAQAVVKSSTEQAEDSLEGMLRVERQVDLAKMGAKAPTGDNINKNNIIKALEGTTTQSTKIAQAIKNGDIKVSILGDELFDRYFGEELALAVGDKIYLRKSSGSLLSETVHEGTHALDFRNMYGFEGTKTEWQWEKRAWFYERQFQKATGGKVEFEKIEDMLMHIYLNYKNKPYNPYE
ncbi:hypothetical protein EDM54_04065 [Brevibacillus borstelensis]|uniref:hypothetical protein n=4 Tax=Brevibacillus borstelensis TaxID=45462 RepID=UPI000F0883C6|nr:hypothetical protein [Brevibacillus borstelensis]RNB65375.1 hypothetical protein EDM54_04065 [Brevibacillus borstelensis]